MGFMGYFTEKILIVRRIYDIFIIYFLLFEKIFKHFSIFFFYCLATK